MYEIYIPSPREKLLREDPKLLAGLEKACGCRIKLSKEKLLEISGSAFDEYNAKNVLTAFGCGFDDKTALLLLDDSYYFDSIDLEGLFDNKKRVLEIKARLIGVGGKTKRYIESVSSARISIYGNSISIIGKMSQVGEADTAIKSIINGTGHHRAYTRMEAMHRRHRLERRR